MVLEVSLNSAARFQRGSSRIDRVEISVAIKKPKIQKRTKAKIKAAAKLSLLPRMPLDILTEVSLKFQFPISRDTANATAVGPVSSLSTRLSRYRPYRENVLLIVDGVEFSRGVDCGEKENCWSCWWAPSTDGYE